MRAASILPAQALRATDADDGTWREEMRESLLYTSALLTRLVLSARELPAPTPDGLLALIDENPMRSKSLWPKKNPLWGRIAVVIFLCGELSHVTGDSTADCFGALAALDASVDFLVALDAGDLV